MSHLGQDLGAVFNLGGALQAFELLRVSSGENMCWGGRDRVVVTHSKVAKSPFNNVCISLPCTCGPIQPNSVD